jgi:hypothetical protein
MSLISTFSCWRCWRAARIWVILMFDSELSTVVVLTLLYEDLDNVFARPNLQTPSFKISEVVFGPLQNFCFDVFSKQTSVITTLQSYTAHICWSAEGLFPRLSPFITLNHTSPKIY